jgi:hypothetical protein
MPPHHVHGQVLHVKTRGVFLGPVVQLADALDTHARTLQHMAPPLGVASVGHGVVPVAGLVHPSTGRKSGPCRHTNRAGGVGVGEPHTPLGEGVQVGGLYHRVASTPHDAGVVLVRHDHDNVLAGHGGLFGLCVT